MNENLNCGEVLCKLSMIENLKMKKVCVAIESLDQTVERLVNRRAELCEKRTDYWEEIYDKYLLTRGSGYNVNWKTGEIIKL